MPNDILGLIANNPTLLAALKNVLLKQFADMPYDLTMSNEALGEITRSKIDGQAKVEAAFKEISKYKTPEPRAERVNNFS